MSKGFTPDLLDRFRREGRGQGTYVRYVPWHRVRRADPSSHGRSHLMAWNGRHIELLSDLEWVGAFFAKLMPNVKDVREQFPLSLETGSHELADYDVRAGGRRLPGTLAIAKELRIRHPRVNGDGRSAPWVMSTDLLLAVGDSAGQIRLIAISCKYPNELTVRRSAEKLQIERAYWRARDVEFLVFSPSLYDEATGLTLRRSFPWIHVDFVGTEVVAETKRIAMRHGGEPIVATIERLDSRFGGEEMGNKAFWQSVWCGALPLDLRRSWRPHLPTNYLDASRMRDLNPIVCGRSSWN